MTVARDAVLEFATFTTTSPATLSFTPVGTPRGITVGIVSNGFIGAAAITGVTYGGVAMQRIGFAEDVNGETGSVWLYFLGASIPTGNQTVSIAHTGTSQTKWAIVQSVTAAGDTEAANVGLIHDDFTNPAFILGSGAVSALRTGIIWSGFDAIASLTPLAGMEALSTADSHVFTIAQNAVGALAQQSTAATGDMTLGFTATVEDAAYLAVSIQEIQSDGFPGATAATLSYFDTPTTAHLVRMPPVVAVGDLLLVGFANNTQTVTTPSGWTLLDAALSASSVKLRHYYKIADGTEDGTTVDFVTGSAALAEAYALRVTNWHGTTPPEVGTFTTSGSSTPDPPSLTPSWGAANTLWLAVYGSNFTPLITAYPANFDNGTFIYTLSTGRNAIGLARRKNNTATENPGTFTLDAAVEWVAQTIAIRPAGPTVPTAPTNLVATALSATSIGLTWDDNSSDETSFRVERSPTGAGSWVTAGTPAANAEAFTDTGRTCATQYFYRVFAVNGAGDSTASNTDDATTSACPPPSGGGNRMGGSGAIRKPPRHTAR